MGKEVGKRAIVRFNPTGEEGEIYIDIDLEPVVSAIGSLESKFDSLLKVVKAIDYKLKNGDGITVGQKILTVQEAVVGVQLPDVPIPAGKKAVIWALSGNVGDTYYGGSQSEAASHEFPVPANQARVVQCANLNQVWIAADNGFDGVAYGVELPPTE